METKKKKERRAQGKKWIKEYKGNNILYAYKRKFKILTIAAINDFQFLGVYPDEAEVVWIKLKIHYNGEQQINKKALEHLKTIIRRNSCDLY